MTRHDALPAAAESLTGRIHALTTLPLSQGEVLGVQEDFLPVLRHDPASLVTATASTTSRADYASRLCEGGFPLALGRMPQTRGRWFDDYVRTSLERDVHDIAPRLRRRAQLPALLEQLAGQTGQVLNTSRVGDALGLDRERPTATPRCSRRCSWCVACLHGGAPCAPERVLCRRCTSSIRASPPECSA